MTIFKSRQVKLDPEPWVAYDPDGVPTRWATRDAALTAARVWGIEWAPRPEFEPTRDSEPWLIVLGPWRNTRVDRQVPESEWAPRRQQFDTPVNRVLVAFREDCADPDFEVNSVVEYAQAWLNNTPGIDVDWDTFDLDEIDHARRVLTRLVNWKEQ